MYLDLKKKNHSLISNLKKLNNFYDYIIIGTGPAASVLINNLVKTNKKAKCGDRRSSHKLFQRINDHLKHQLLLTRSRLKSIWYEAL